ncbi:MAG: TMEM165/GDT1 family protein [Acinetobacter sp.]|jgi:putative Ca2+/H+ antiporter (TMEM165/GDT1 family)|nr:MAG: TMEM165/GDT1 family protein [Acinetobacter sp.]
MDAFLISTGLVALAEMGDKTQLLALLLAAKFRKPIPIILAILIATLVNHALAAAVGQWLTALVPVQVMHWILALSFIAMGAWMLIPDKLDDESGSVNRWQKYGVFATTFILFFLAEMGDKTQIATVALSARFDDFIFVVMGTTAGMMLANAPAVIIGDKMANRLPIALIHKIAAAIFFILGVAMIVQFYLG